MIPTMAALTLLAALPTPTLLAAAPTPTLLAGDDSGKAGPLGLLVLVLLGIASYFLFRSMSQHLRRVRDDYPGPGSVERDRPEAEPSADDPDRPAASETSTETAPAAAPPAPGGRSSA